MTPLCMIILIECHVCDKPGTNIKPEIWNSSAATECLRSMFEAGLITHPDFPHITDKGRVWL